MASASVTSAGEALSSRTPSGRPPPSTSTIHFVPLASLVLPTAEPLFSLERSGRPGTPLPTVVDLRRRARPATLARHRAIHPAPPTASTAANRSSERDTCRAKTSTLRLSATPQNALKAVTVRCPRTTPLVLAALRLRQQRIDQPPLRIVQQLKWLLAHATSASNHSSLAEFHSLRPNLFMKHALGLMLVDCPGSYPRFHDLFRSWRACRCLLGVCKPNGSRKNTSGMWSQCSFTGTVII